MRKISPLSKIKHLFDMSPDFTSSVIVGLIIKLSPYWRSPEGRVPLGDWLDLAGSKLGRLLKLTSTFCSKMASLTAVVQTSQSGPSLSSKKRNGTMTQRRSRLWDNNVLLFLSLASMLHCAGADGKMLVLLDNFNIRDTHSIFFRSLAGQ